MFALDSVGLSWALRRLAGESDSRWQAAVEGFEPFADLSAQLPLTGSPPRTTTINTSSTADDLCKLAARYKITPRDYEADGPGAVTATVQQLHLTIPALLARVRRVGTGGGYHQFLVVSGKEALVYDFCYPLAPGGMVPDWAPARYRRESVVSVPVQGGRLWLVPAARGSVFELYNRARQAIVETAGMQPSDRWGSILWPTVTANVRLRVTALQGATLGGKDGVELLDIYQMLKLDYALADLPRTPAPKTDPDEPFTLAYNGPTLVFRTGMNDQIQWLYHMGVRDWDVFGIK